jgi:PAS domain S-box-containing protein
MKNDINKLLKENEKLIHDKNELSDKLNEANEIIEAIRKGTIDAVLISNNKNATVLVSESADLAYRKFVENMSEGVISLNTAGIIIYSNSSFAKIVNKPLEKVMGTNVRKFIPGEYVEIFERFFNDFSENNSKVELSILNDEGIHTHFIVSLNTLQLQDFVALNLVWTDVTDHKKAEENLITLNENLKKAIEEHLFSEKKVVILNNRLKENIKILEDANIELATFAHIASHDLQEPLRKIITFSSMLITDYHDVIDQRGQKYINSMQRATERMRNLINDILEYSQLSQKDLSFQPTNLQSIVDEIFSNLEIVINETKAKIRIEKELPVIEANTSQMRQLFQNLISNALKFIKADRIPEISITYKFVSGNELDISDKSMLNEKFCKFYIKDNGIGFKEEYINKIFTIFQRLHNNSAYVGTGIGLAICKKIVEKHNGYISAESKSDEGSLFTIILPVSQAIIRNQNQINDQKKKREQLFESTSS